MKNILVSDIMTRYPVTVKPDTDILSCIKEMLKKRVNSVLITERKKLVGMISQQDIMWALTKKGIKELKKIKAIDISPKKIATIKPSATIKEVILRMNNMKFEKLPVVKDKDLVGIVTIKDILNFHPEFYPEIDEFAEIREESEKMKRVKNAKEGKLVTRGICEECGDNGLLYRLNGMLICESCRSSV